MEKLDAESVRKFWQEHQDSGFIEIFLNADTETGSFTSTERDWQRKLNLPAMGVRLNVTSLAERWSNLAESIASDSEYECLVQSEAAENLKVLLNLCPANIVVVGSTIDGA